jgi:dephospho-CoA kinase
MIVGFTGKRGSGKDTAAERLVKGHGFTALDFTRDVLSPILKGQKKEITRDNLIDLAMEGRKNAGNGIWAEKMCSVMHGMKRGDYTISGVRFPEEAHAFRKEFGADFVLVSILCDDRKRYERCMKRGTKGENGMTFETYMQTEGKPTEKIISDTMNLADYVIDNNGSMPELSAVLDQLITLIKSRA